MNKKGLKQGFAFILLVALVLLLNYAAISLTKIKEMAQNSHFTFYFKIA